MGEHPCCPLPRMEGLGGSHLMWMGVGVLLPPSPPFPLSLSPFLVQAKGRQKRVKAVVDCKGDKARELTFSKGEVIVVTREEDEQSWVSTACHGPPPRPAVLAFPSFWSTLLGDAPSMGVTWVTRVLLNHSMTPPLPAPPLCTPRLDSLKVTAPAPVSSPPASCTSCRTDCVPIARSIPTGLVAHGVGCGRPPSPPCCRPLHLASGP